METKDEKNESNQELTFQELKHFLNKLILFCQKRTYLLLGIILMIGIAFRIIYSADGVRYVATEFALEAVHMKAGIYDPNILWLHLGIRYVQLYLYYILISLFGVSEKVMFSVTFTASIGSIILIYFIGKKLFSKEVGLLAAFLFAIFPLDIFNATNVESDGLMALWIGCALFLYYVAVTEEKQWYWFVGVGFLLSLGFFTKIFAVLAFPIIGLYELLVVKKYDIKRIARIALSISIGFFILTGPIFLYQYKATGDIFYNIHVEKGMPHAITITKTWPLNYFQPKENLNLGAFPRFMFNVIPGIPWKEILLDENYSLLHVYFIVLILALLHYMVNPKKETTFLMIWIFLPFLFIEGYIIISKVQRYLTILIVPTIVLVSAFLFTMYSRIEKENQRKWIAFLFIIVFLSITILQLGTETIFKPVRIWNGERYHHTEEVIASILKDYPEKDTYVTGYNQISILNFYFQYSKNYSGPDGYRGPTATSFYDLHFINNWSEIQDAYIIIDAIYDSYDVDIYGYYNLTNSSLENVFKSPVPTNWENIAMMDNNGYNGYIFYAPPKGNESTEEQNQN